DGLVTTGKVTENVIAPDRTADVRRRAGTVRVGGEARVFGARRPGSRLPLLADGTCELVRARFRDGVDHLTGRASQVGAERRALDVDILDVELVGVGVSDAQVTERWIGDARAVEQEQILLPSTARDRRESRPG